MFPLYLKRSEEMERPREPFAYIAGKNGFFLQKSTGIFRATVPVQTVPMLAEVKEEAEYLLPPIPPQLAAQILSFFRAVYEREKSEAILLIAYDFERGIYALEAPEQTGTAAHCKYTMPQAPPAGFSYVGTVHSHCDMGAFHSGTDQHDEEFFDGIHLTFGRISSARIDIVSTLAVNGRRFSQPVERVCAGVRKEVGAISVQQKVGQEVVRRDIQGDDDRLGQFLKRTGLAKIFGFRRHRREIVLPEKPVEVTTSLGSYSYQPDGYVIDLPPGVTADDCKHDPAWMAKVQTRPPVRAYVYTPHYQSYPANVVGFRHYEGQRQIGFATEPWYDALGDDVCADAPLAKTLDGSPDTVVKVVRRNEDGDDE